MVVSADKDHQGQKQKSHLAVIKRALSASHGDDPPATYTTEGDDDIQAAQHEHVRPTGWHPG